MQTHDPIARQHILDREERRLDDEDNIGLNCPITEREIKAAIDDSASHKAPGTDGLPAEFYKYFWPELKELMTELFNYIIDNKTMSSSQSTGIVTLLHKKGVRSDLANWRPITLLCSDYKLLAKVISQRVKAVLPKIAEDEQTGGMGDRNIAQNLERIRNVIEYFSAAPGTRGATIVSLDFEKAYDKVDRTFLWSLMTKIGFNSRFIDTVATLYDHSQARVNVNGELGEPFNLERGVRQGCPLAMYMYIIFINPLLHRLKDSIKGASTGFTDFKVAGYVDDIVVFTDSLDDLWPMERELDRFTRATNSNLNKNKTNSLALGKMRRTQVWPIDWLGFQEEVKMLGIEWSETTTLTTTRNSDRLVRKARQEIGQAYSRNLTIGQKTMFFNSFIASKFQYYAQVLPLSKRLVMDVQKLGANFIWRNRFERLALSRVYDPIEKGGLGLVNLAIKAQAALLKVTISRLAAGDPTCPNTKMLDYWLRQSLGHRLKSFESVKTLKKAPGFLRDITPLIIKVNDSKDVGDLVTGRQIYNFLLSGEKETPKIMLIDDSIDRRAILKNIKNKHLSQNTSNIYFCRHMTSSPPI